MIFEKIYNIFTSNNIEDIKVLGWNFYMPPEQAARGIILFEEIDDQNPDTGGSWSYVDISGYSAWGNDIV